MAKTKTINPSTFIQNKECFSRMNFLYQASMLMAGRNNTLATFYGQLCRSVGKKAVLRIEPELNRNLCKRCSIAIKPSITADVKVHQIRSDNKRKRRRKKPAHTENNIDVNNGVEVHVVCRQCDYKKNYVMREHNLWLEQRDCVVEEISLNADSGESDKKL